MHSRAHITSRGINSDIKFMRRLIGSAPEYETGLQADLNVRHSSYRDLWFKVQRRGWAVMCIYQGLLNIDETSYSQLDEGRRILVLYRPNGSY